MARAGLFVYDPTVEVFHHVAPRHDQDSLHRGQFEPTATTDNAYNETYVTMRHAPGLRKWTALLYQLIIGSSLAPGMFHATQQTFARDPHSLARIGATVRGRAAAVYDVFNGGV